MLRTSREKVSKCVWIVCTGEGSSVDRKQSSPCICVGLYRVGRHI
jgi:hypothetical protein